MMPSDKENQGAPKPSEVKKRPLVQSPFTAGTPSTRPGPREMARSLGSWGDPNLEETLVANETFNMCDVKEGLSESIAQEHRLPAGAKKGKHEADPNIEKTFVERRSMCDETMVHAKNVSDPRPSEEGTIGPLVSPGVLQLLPDQSRLKSCKKSSTKSCQLVRDCDVNVVCTREVIETVRSYETVTSDPSPLIPMTQDAEELEAGDIKYEANKGGVPTGPFASPQYKSPLSPVPDVSRDGAISQESGVPRCLDWEASLVYPQRKYNMNDSEISFLLNENRVLQEEENRLAQVEAEKAELSKELGQCKQELAVGDSALSKASKQLVELEREKELAEKTITDYEFIVMDLKKKHNKQQEDLQSQCAVVEEQLGAEKLARDAANREIVQLRNENNAAIEALEKAKAALTDAENRAAAAERNLKDYIKCHTEELMDKYVLSEAKLAEAYSEGSQQKSKEIEAEMKELKRLLELKTREIDRLGSICDKFDEVEADYRQKLFSVVRERDQLKAQLEPTKVPEVPKPAALTEGTQTLSPKTIVQLLVGNDERLESAVESAAAPNRSLHTTLNKKLDKTVKLSDTPESKANTSRST